VKEAPVFPQVELLEGAVAEEELSVDVPLVGCSVVGVVSLEPPSPGMNLRATKNRAATISKVIRRREKVVSLAIVSGEY